MAGASRRPFACYPSSIADMGRFTTMMTAGTPGSQPAYLQAPFLQVPPGHLLPSPTGLETHAPVGAVQVSVVQGLASLHVLATPLQSPNAHASAVVRFCLNSLYRRGSHGTGRVSALHRCAVRPPALTMSHKQSLLFHGPQQKGRLIAVQQTEFHRVRPAYAPRS